ncbi:MAG TPA: LysR family transcriptional regulator [Mycobacteriales bacterium]|nr:LysR family transcriptional regulator [Mycobacteriales bacterium]
MAETVGPTPPEVSLLRLRVFAAVVDQGGYSAAARVLGLSQPTVSFHVRALEHTFGGRLLVYRGRRVHPTATGLALHRLAGRTLRDFDELTAELAALRAGRAGRVRLGASIAFEQAFFFDRVVAPYRLAQPRIELSLRFGTSQRMVRAVRSREADLAYVMRRHPVGAAGDASVETAGGTGGDLRYTPLHGSRVAFFVATDHPLAAQPHPSAASVGAAGLVTAPLNTVEWEYYGQALHHAGLEGYRVSLQVSGIQARVLAARAGLGVIVVFWPSFGPDPALPGLVPLRMGGTPPAGPPGPEFGLVERVEAGTPPVVREFAGWLRRVVSDPADPADLADSADPVTG